MGSLLNLITQYSERGANWLASAWSDETKVFAAIVQSSTPKSLELSAVAVVSLFIVLWFYSRASVRLKESVRIKNSANKFASALSGYAQFRAARPADFLEHAADFSTPSRMARTETRQETKVMDVRPYNEQATIDLMGRFKWRLQNSQRIRWQDSHLETRGDKIYSVTEGEDYVHLVFVRDLDEPNLAEIRSLEREYFSIVIPQIPGYWAPGILMFLGLMTGPVAIVILALCIAWIVNISKRRKVAEEQIQKLRARQAAILARCDEL